MKPKILVLSYGGTIVMRVDHEKKAVVCIEDTAEILSLLPDISGIGDITFEILENKDSTNVTPADWTRLSMALHDRYDDYDAFVVTHGTNTMAYTASAITLALGKSYNKPIVFTGSQLPLSYYGNDARFNFENALKVAAESVKEKISEVMIVFNDLVLRGCRTVKVSESDFRAFKSPAFPELGKILSTGVHFSPIINRVDEIQSKQTVDLRPHFSTNILSMDLTPGLMPSLIEGIVKNGVCKGVILKSHGAGSVPTENEYSFLPLIEKLVRTYKIPTIVSTKFLGGNSYKKVNDECAVEAIQAGAIPGGDLTDVMTEVKLMWLLAQDFHETNDIKKYLLHDFVGEVSEIDLTSQQ